MELGRQWTAPIPYGQPAIITDGDQQFRVTVTDVARNASAQVKKANIFNAAAPAGMDYLLVKAKLEYLKGSQDKPFHTPSSGQSVIADGRMFGTLTISVTPKPEFAGQDIFPGATVEGWLEPFIVPKGAMDSALLSYGKRIFDNSGGTWFSLSTDTDHPQALPQLSPSENVIDASTASTRSAAAAVGVPVLLKDHNSVIELKVTDVIRDATREVKAANSLNQSPDPGNGYLLIKMKARYISGPADQPWTTPTGGDSVFALSRMFGESSHLMVAPEPDFGGVDLFPGAEVEGWLPVMELPKEGLATPILSYGKGLFGGGDTWFALP